MRTYVAVVDYKAVLETSDREAAIRELVSRTSTRRDNYGASWLDVYPHGMGPDKLPQIVQLARYFCENRDKFKA